MSVPDAMNVESLSNEPLKLETDVVRLEEKRLKELASGAEQVGLTGEQAKLANALAKLAMKGKSVAGAEGLTAVRADGMTSGDLAAIISAVDQADSAAETELFAANAGEAIAAAASSSGISGGESVSEASFFKSLKTGLNSLMQEEKMLEKFNEQGQGPR